MDPISSSTPSWPPPTPSAPITVESPRIGPYYSVRVINDAVETTILALEAMADLGVGARFDTLA